MAKKKTSEKAAKMPAGLKNMVSKYRSTAESAAKSEEARQRLVRDIVEMAMKKERSRIRVVEHDLRKPSAKPRVSEFEFTDPRAAALRIERFCNIKFALPFWVCLTMCPAFIPFPLPPIIWLGYFLVGCDVNVCNLTITCYYIAI
jgi:hypothetical protein